MAYLRTSLSYYERGGMSAYPGPGPRVALRGLRGIAMVRPDQIAPGRRLGQDDGSDDGGAPSIPDTSQLPPLSPPSAPYTPSPQLPGYQASYGPPNIPNVLTSGTIPTLTPQQIASLSTAQPSILAAGNVMPGVLPANVSLQTWMLLGLGLVAAAVAFGAGARR